MDPIKLNVGLPIQMSSNTIKSKHPQDTQQPGVSNGSANCSETSEQMAALIDIVKTSSNTSYDKELVEDLREQIQSGQYSINVLSLTEHLFQELSVEGGI